MKRDCQHPRARHRHGTLAAYRLDCCKCFACRLARSRAEAAYKRGDGWRETMDCWIPSHMVARRLQALMALGYTAADVSARCGLPTGQLHNLRVGQRPSVTPTTAERVFTAYEELSGTPCAAGHAKRTRADAQRRGYAPPLAWDDIDNPLLRAAPGTSRASRTAEQMSAERAHFRGYGFTDEQVAARLGVSTGAVYRAVYRTRDKVA